MFALYSLSFSSDRIYQYSLSWAYINPDNLNECTKEIMHAHTVWNHNYKLHNGAKIRFDYAKKITPASNFGVTAELGYFLKSINFKSGSYIESLNLDIISLMAGPIVFYNFIENDKFIFRTGGAVGPVFNRVNYHINPGSDESENFFGLKLIIPFQLSFASTESGILMLDWGIELMFSQDRKFKLPEPDENPNLNTAGIYLGITYSKL